MVVVNPLARRSARFFDDGHKDTFEGYRGFPVERNACLLCSGEDPTSFRVVLLANDESRVRATVFSSDTGEWKIHPWVDVPGRPRRTKMWLLNSNMQANGFLYWVYKNHKYMVTLDTTTMEFSVEELPLFLKDRRRSFVVGETNNGTPCIVYAIDFTVGVLLRRTDSDGVEKWMLDRATPLGTQLGGVLGKLKGNYDELLIVAVRDGFAYLATSEKIYDAQNPSWFLSLCLETMKLENLFQRTYDSGVHPYIMAWPPCLVGNYGRFGLEDGT
uniref:F-box protein AT5G49610-like beta-propeller domain-containing protein n=1 Tax=Arundo donax TaxID=35708 RepID=A0A0A9BBZ4_ARUDO